jgi:hypothetical protein
MLIQSHSWGQIVTEIIEVKGEKKSMKYETCNRWYCNPRVIDIDSLYHQGLKIRSFHKFWQKATMLITMQCCLGRFENVFCTLVWTEASTNVCMLWRLVNCGVFTMHVRKCFVLATESFFFSIKIFNDFL